MSRPSSRVPPAAAPHGRLIAIPIAVSIAVLAGCSGSASDAGSSATAPSGGTPVPSAAGSPSATAPAAGSTTCPTVAEISALFTGAFGSGAQGGTVTRQSCTAGWAAARLRLDSGVTGRVALRLVEDTWTPVLVDGAEGRCPSTVGAAPAPVKQVLGC